jgi:hypothetical protein
LAILSLVAACGGRAQEEQPDAATASGGTPSAPMCSDDGFDAACPELNIDLSFDPTVASGPGVEVLQLPDYEARPSPYTPTYVPTDPSARFPVLANTGI